MTITGKGTSIEIKIKSGSTQRDKEYNNTLIKFNLEVGRDRKRERERIRDRKRR